MLEQAIHTVPRIGMPALDGAMLPAEPLLDFRTFTSLRRMAAHQYGKQKIGRADFIKQLMLYLPEVAARIEESDFGVVHLEAGALRLATRDAIAEGDFVAVRRHLWQIAELFERADAELLAALRISYLEALFLDETSAAYRKARSLLSRPMENMLRQIEARWKKSRLLLEP